MNDPNVGWAVRLPDGRWLNVGHLCGTWRERTVFHRLNDAKLRATWVAGDVRKITRRVVRKGER